MKIRGLLTQYIRDLPEKYKMEGRMRYKYFGFFLFLSFFITPVAFAEDGPQVEMFSPQGTVKGVRQVSVRFSEQMVPFGDPRGLIDPFDIDCPEKGSQPVGRWEELGL